MALARCTECRKCCARTPTAVDFTRVGALDVLGIESRHERRSTHDRLSDRRGLQYGGWRRRPSRLDEGFDPKSFARVESVATFESDAPEDGSCRGWTLTPRAGDFRRRADFGRASGPDTRGALASVRRSRMRLALAVTPFSESILAIASRPDPFRSGIADLRKQHSDGFRLGDFFHRGCSHSLEQFPRAVDRVAPNLQSCLHRAPVSVWLPNPSHT
jgi:hypothetical protein